MGVRIIRIALTGGPCGGKTSARVAVLRYFSARGWRVIFVPEAATELISNGAGPWSGESDPLAFQETIFRLQLAHEEVFGRRARQLGEKVMLVFDRPLGDGAAYCESHEWAQVLMRMNTTPTEVRSRYDLVVHLVTAADGAEAYYTTANNEARNETPEQARAVDLRTRRAHLGANLFVATNEVSFDEKLNRVLTAIAEHVGDPVPLQRQRKYLVRCGDTAPEGVEHRISQFYFTPTDTGMEVRVRRVVDQFGGVSYFRTEVSAATSGDGARTKSERMISPAEFADLSLLREATQRVIAKQRTFSIEPLGARPMRLDRFDASSIRPGHVLGVEGYGLLELDVLPHEKSGPIEFSVGNGFTIEREVTGDPEFKNSYLASA